MIRLAINRVRCLYRLSPGRQLGKIGWQVATGRFTRLCSPHEGQEYRVRKGPSETVRSLRSGPLGPGLLLLYTMFLTSHRQRDVRTTWKSARMRCMRMCYNKAHTHLHARVRAWVRARRLAATPWNQLRNHGVPLPSRNPPASPRPPRGVDH